MMERQLISLDNFTLSRSQFRKFSRVWIASNDVIKAYRLQCWSKDGTIATLEIRQKISKGKYPDVYETKIYSTLQLQGQTQQLPVLSVPLTF